MARFAFFLALLAAVVQSSPTPEVHQRDFAKGKSPAAVCKKVNIVITVLKVYEATPFCSTYLGIPAVTSTSIATTTTTVTSAESTVTATSLGSAVTATSTVTVSSGTSYVFLPGNSPTPDVHRREQDIEGRNNNLQKPAYLKPFAEDVISSGCKCLDIPVKTIVTSTTSTATSTSTIESATVITVLRYTTTVVSTLTVRTATTTLYPCATPIPILVPNLPFGDAISSTDLGLGPNGRFELGDPRGASAEACCNACYFGIQNCIQAFWYSYQGCVYQTASAPGSGVGVSSSCPSGLFSGLTYEPDNSPAFRSTGDFAGPCGVQYNNLPAQ